MSSAISDLFIKFVSEPRKEYREFKREKVKHYARYCTVNSPINTDILTIRSPLIEKWEREKENDLMLFVRLVQKQ